MMKPVKIIELGHVVLYVSDIERSAHFYGEVLGFEQISKDAGTALYSSGRTHHELLLIEIGGSPKEPSHPTPGLYHIGFKIGDGHQAIIDAYQYLRELGVRIVGTADHTVTESIYVLDPDGNELELYSDMGDGWKTNPKLIMAPVKTLKL
jgi:catechol 2,3-dioxygenase